MYLKRWQYTAVEEMIVLVDPDYVQRWIEADLDIWTHELITCAGFESKEIWLSRDRPGEITVIIYWSDFDAWKNLDQNWVHALEQRMIDCVGATHIYEQKFLNKTNQKFRVYQF